MVENKDIKLNLILKNRTYYAILNNITVLVFSDVHRKVRRPAERGLAAANAAKPLTMSMGPGCGLDFLKEEL